MRPFKKLSGLIVILVCCMLLACSHAQYKSSDGTAIIQGKNDAREYRYLQLDNGLKILLISDDKTDLASVSLHVGVGSGHDPLSRQGLAHFLEHMLFLGTEKYPQAEGFQNFISASGGQHNAYTALDHTNYFFTVAPKALDEALDRFSQFFVHPLFDARYVEQEKHAVHSEFQAGLRNDSRRQRDVLATLMKKEHGLAKFSVGSLVTLGGEEDGLLEDLHTLFGQYYVASNMGLAVLSPRSLDDLEQEVTKRFAAVSAKPLEQEVWAQNPFAIELPQQLYIQPEKQLHELAVLFPIPALDYQGKQSHVLLAHMLGDEGEGSLHAELKSQGMIDSLSAGLAWQYEGGAAFAVHFSLTEKGRQHQQDIANALFEAIALLKQQSQSLKVIYQDLQQIERLSFDYQEADEPLSAVISAANNLPYYDAQQILLGAKHFAQFDLAHFKRLLASLRIDNALFVHLDALEEGKQQLSPYYQAAYRLKALDAEFYTRLQQAQPSQNLVLMQENPFIAQELSVLEQDSSAAPYLLLEQEQGELWYRGVGEFNLPRASSYYSFILPEEKLTGLDSVALELYLDLLKDSLNTWAYPVYLAKMDFSIYRHLRGMTIRLQGFSDQQQGLLETLLKQIQQAEFSQEQFERLKQRKARQWKNSEKNPPYQRLTTMLNELLLKPNESLAVQQQHLQTLTLGQVQAYAQQFFQGAYLRALNNGNISQRQAKQQFASAYRLLESTKQSAQQAKMQVVKLAESAELTMQSEHSDALLAEYWQGQADSYQQQALWLLLAQASSSAFFNDMRTEKQLGYVVYARYWPQLSVPGLAFVIQSPAASELELYRELQQWQQSKLEELAKIELERLQGWQDAVVQQIDQSDKSLEEQSSRYWYQLALKNTQFDNRQQLLDAVTQVDLPQWQHFVAQLPAKKLLISTKKRCFSELSCVLKPQDIKTEAFYEY